uniref:Uncharacterized protein n=1 Tax=Lactuca sativa TaxID=4236 RepID=A0A9R1VUU0_LACSA|nr:hypothetical protein LSAT_V11C400203660 [Lactuca sativa]
MSISFNAVDSEYRLPFHIQLRLLLNTSPTPATRIGDAMAKMVVSLWGGLTALKKLTCVEVAPSLQMVEVRKAGGDTLEFHKVNNNFLSVGNANIEILVFNFNIGRLTDEIVVDSKVNLFFVFEKTGKVNQK